MKFFQSIPIAPPLGPILREARESYSLSLEDVAKATYLSLEEIESLEEDHPIDPRRARIQAVSYLRFLQMNPSDFKNSLPALPLLKTGNQSFLANATKRVKSIKKSPLEMLAPMGRLALTLVLTIALFGAWGLMRQLSRVRSMPWVSSTYTVPVLPSR